MSKVLSIRWTPKDALDGMHQLDAMEELAYRRLIDLVYVSDDNLEDDDKKLAWMTKTGRKWKTIKSTLIRLGKIEVSQHKIVIRKCQSVLQEARNYIEQKKGAGKTSAQKRKTLKDNNTDSTDVITGNVTDVITEPPTPVPTDVSTGDPTSLKPLALSKKEDRTTTTSREDARGEDVVVEGKSFEGRCYQIITAVFPGLMAKSMIPISQWKAMGITFENVLLALETVKNQGATPDHFAYFTPIITKILNAGTAQKNSKLPSADETYEQYCSRLGLTPEYGEQAHA